MMKLIFILSMVSLLMSCSNLIKNGAMVEAQKALNNKDYAEALESTDIAESFGDRSDTDYAKLYYLRAQALEGLGQQEEAVLSYRYVIEQHGSSAYAPPSQQRLDALSVLSTN